MIADVNTAGSQRKSDSTPKASSNPPAVRGLHLTHHASPAATRSPNSLRHQGGRSSAGGLREDDRGVAAGMSGGDGAWLEEAKAEKEAVK